MINFFYNKKVWISGISGFKGTWLGEWLLMMGAKVAGYALEPVTTPAIFDQLKLAKRIDRWECGDIRDKFSVVESIVNYEPDFVFHLAAQPLVRFSYLEPIATYEVNLFGTINVLEALRKLEKPCVAVMITTDKCYENKEWVYAYREEDALGGYDPYSSSKACCEIAISCWRRSFFNSHPVHIYAVRAGNVIGGGDWAEDRIVPDAIRALQQGKEIRVRNPYSTRPWQHVLEPLAGYLLLAWKVWSEGEQTILECGIGNTPYSHAFNFGPSLTSNRTVKELVEEILKHWQGVWKNVGTSDSLHEAGKLNLATDKAYHCLGWRPRWDFETAVRKTVEWYRWVWEGGDPAEITRKQIEEYTKIS
ncbi:MAG: CDP-glucose 4,6-dehydratase [Chthoniobacterales bacterium]|nr:CDP-glucose 4,6-dehydratase [Chthoniobacterales bacterium]